MSFPKNIYQKYLEHRKTPDKESHENLANFLERIFSKKRSFEYGLLNEQIGKEIFQPSDFCRDSYNRKEVVYRMLYSNLSKNNLNDARNCLLRLMDSYYSNFSIVWRAGFHILREIGTQDELDQFFKEMIKINIFDQNNMIYEYMLHLIKIENFEGVTSLFDDEFIQQRLVCHSNRATNLERELVPLLIKMTVAVSCYCLWKKSLNIEDFITADGAATRAEMYFSEMEKLIDRNQPIDNYILNYLDLLLAKDKYTEAFRILKLYHEKCPKFINSSRYLLRFMIQYKDMVPEIDADVIPELRVNFVAKMMPITTKCDQFTLKMLRDSIDYLEGQEDYELLAEILFELLEHSGWSEVGWPWQKLNMCVNKLGVTSDIVVEKWTVRKRYWPKIYNKCEQAQSLLELLKYMFED